MWGHSRGGFASVESEDSDPAFLAGLTDPDVSDDFGASDEAEDGGRGGEGAGDDGGGVVAVDGSAVAVSVFGGVFGLRVMTGSFRAAKACRSSFRPRSRLVCAKDARNYISCRFEVGPDFQINWRSGRKWCPW